MSCKNCDEYYEKGYEHGSNESKQDYEAELDYITSIFNTEIESLKDDSEYMVTQAIEKTERVTADAYEERLEVLTIVISQLHSTIKELSAQNYYLRKENAAIQQTIKENS